MKTRLLKNIRLNKIKNVAYDLCVFETLQCYPETLFGDGDATHVAYLEQEKPNEAHPSPGLIWIQSFPSSRQVIITRKKSSVCVTTNS